MRSAREGEGTVVKGCTTPLSTRTTSLQDWGASDLAPAWPEAMLIKSIQAPSMDRRLGSKTGLTCQGHCVCMFVWGCVCEGVAGFCLTSPQAPGSTVHLASQIKTQLTYKVA